MKSMINLTADALLQLHAAVLFTYDTNGSMLQANEPWADKGPAPLFFLGQSVTGMYIRQYRYDVPETIVQQLETLAVTITDALPYQQLLQTDKTEGGPAFLVPENFTAVIPGIPLSTAHAPLLGPEFAWLLPELGTVQPCAGVVINGQVVSVCRSVRISAEAHEAGIETLPSFRGQGYAAAALACWAALVRDTGALPLYSTSWQNQASRSVARKAGLIHYGSTLSVG
ncbi:GNAT family N-acetyltransferase [Chitinophaga qingshengii]|uniref:GNAT family N-acetyltransferase n=1 Tax=Chitinophaga qingshengii TaxID=1569794 RepID=A0ABR7TU59_9BACT|nr:GNAT family N-acetyltransferase [Chitinophaga qingshengii]MBC9933190.1 GNAT family N-acetyltransferase [Chitinophaga qingshengii]